MEQKRLAVADKLRLMVMTGHRQARKSRLWKLQQERRATVGWWLTDGMSSPWTPSSWSAVITWLYATDKLFLLFCHLSFEAHVQATLVIFALFSN